MTLSSINMRTIGIAAILACATSFPARASLITNGGFESGLAGWTTLDQFGGDGTFLAQTGTSSPVNGFPVPCYPQCLQRAHENAALVDFDFTVFQDYIFDGIREALGNESAALDVFRLQDADPAQRRYS